MWGLNHQNMGIEPVDQRIPWIYKAQPFQPQRVPPFLGNKENISMDYSLATVVRTAE